MAQYGDFDDDEYGDDYEPASFRWMSVVVLLLAVGGFFSLAWYAYHTGTKSMKVEDVIIIEAESEPIRTAPEDPGGQQFPHQDKSIYQAFSPDDEKPETEKLLPEPEQPETPRVAEAPEGATTSYVNKRLLKGEKPAPARKQAEKAAPTPAAQPAPVAATKPAAKPKPVEKEPEITLPKQAEPKERSVGRYDGYKVQLGAFRSRDEAVIQWNKVRKSHIDVLDGHEHAIVKADLGGKGIYYRLRVGGFESKPDAAAACATLSKRNQACFVAGK
ncbi:MAG: hypothetical protein CMM94_03680 [Rickettsiales bacterium]|nr:hypothetical protein [Rickettsiales bacterium]